MKARSRVLVVVAAGAAVLGVATSGAQAAVCGDESNPGLFAPGGYEFDFTESPSATPDRNDAFATLYDGGSNGPADSPPGLVSVSDSYDQWGALFVGPGGGSTEANLYYAADNNSCHDELGGGVERVFPSLPLNGLRVQRKIFVPSSGRPGARILNLITNRTGKVKTTTVQIGDTLSSDNDGDLGSDSGTIVASSSSGDQVLSAADRWAVTGDATPPGLNSDAALAHVIDGPGARKRIAFATLTGIAAGTGSVQDNLAWQWQKVRIQPGQTVALVSYEVQQVVANRDAVAEDAKARSQALAYQAAGPAALFTQMTIMEKAAVLNWRTPVRCGGRRVTIAGTAGNDKIVGTAKADVIYTGGGKDKVKGLGGNDRICLGKGNDRAAGGGGNDRIYGNAGRDTILGNGGKDRLAGGPGGPDRCIGGPPSAGDTAAGCEFGAGIP